VTVATYPPERDPVQDRVEVPEPPLMLLGERVQTRFVELVVTARSIDPVKPFREATVIVEMPETPTLVETLLGFAVTVKSCAWYFTVALCERPPLVPFTVAR
jgi:hypothetical protein